MWVEISTYLNKQSTKWLHTYRVGHVFWNASFVVFVLQTIIGFFCHFLTYSCFNILIDFWDLSDHHQGDIQKNSNYSLYDWKCSFPKHMTHPVSQSTRNIALKIKQTSHCVEQKLCNRWCLAMLYNTPPQVI